MDYIRKFDYISTMNENDNYKINNGHTNVCFITSCRGLVLSIYLDIICKHIPYFINWQLGKNVIAVHIVVQKFNQPTQNMKLAIENADIIICECIKNYTYINTLKTCEDNIFKKFNIKSSAKLHMIPNLSIAYYINDIKYLYSDDFINFTEDMISTLKQKNLEKLIYWCKYYDYTETAIYIENNINIKRLFFTHNHPMTELLIILFKELVNKAFNYNLTYECLNYLKKVRILDSNNDNKTLLVDLDYKLGMDKNIN